MSIDSATFVVQRGDAQLSCLGSELGERLRDDDLLIAQRGDNHGSIVKGNIQDADLFIVTDEDNGHKSVTGAQVKKLFADEPKPWQVWLNGSKSNHWYLEVIVTEENSCTVLEKQELWDADTLQPVLLTPNGKSRRKKTTEEGANIRRKRHIETFKESEEFNELSEAEQTTILEQGQSSFYSGYYYYYGDTEPLPIGRWIIGGNQYTNFAPSEGDFELGPETDFSKVQTLMYRDQSVFSDISKFSNMGKPLPDWDMSSVEARGLNYMFRGTLLNDDLSHWCVPRHTAIGSVGTKQKGKDPVWGTCNGVTSQPPFDPFTELVWNQWTYIGLQEAQLDDKDDFKYQRWELEGPSGSPPTRGNCLFVKKSHDHGPGSHADWITFICLTVGMYIEIKGIRYKITESADGNQYNKRYNNTWWYIQLSGINGAPDPDFYKMWNSKPDGTQYASSQKIYFDTWRAIDRWTE